MNDFPAIPPSDDAMKEAERVVHGYTVSFRDSCMTRIGAEYVMRDGAHRCIRLLVATTDILALGAKWAEFSRSDNEIEETSGTTAAPWHGTVHPKDAALVLQGYMPSTHGVCLVRVVGHYVTRDGVRRHVRFLVDAVDPTMLGAAWAIFGGAAGWVHAASGLGLEILHHPVGNWADAAGERMASD